MPTLVLSITCTQDEFSSGGLIEAVKKHAPSAKSRLVVILDTSSWLTPESGIIRHWKLLDAQLIKVYLAGSDHFVKSGKLDAIVDVIFLAWHKPASIGDVAGAIPGPKRIVSINLGHAYGTSPLEPGPSFSVSALGGTFDHIHAGHKVLLTLGALATTQRLVVGVTGDALLKNKKFADYLEDGPTRAEAARSFLSLVNPGIYLDIVFIEDVYGPTASDPAIEALIVSEETQSGANTINEERSRRSLRPLQVLTIGLLQGQDAENKLSSTDLRKWHASQSGLLSKV